MMGTEIDCDLVKRDLAAFRAGWMRPSRMDDVRAHLAECPACAEALRREARRAAELEQFAKPIPIAEPPAKEPEPPEAVRRFLTPQRSELARTGVGVVLAVAVVLFALHMNRQTGSVWGRWGPATATDGLLSPGTDSAVMAHDVLAIGETTGDPNRAVLRLYATVARQGDSR